MPQTSDAYFLNAAQAAPGTEVWADLDNLLELAGEASVPSLSSSENTQTVTLTDPANAGEMGPSDQITDIRVRISTYYEGATSAVINAEDIQIAGGNAKSGDIPEDIETTLTFDGDLAYWGITEQQARDFVDGTEELIFHAGHVSGANATKVAVVWVDVRFDFIEISTLVNLPTLF